MFSQPYLPLRSNIIGRVSRNNVLVVTNQTQQTFCAMILTMIESNLSYPNLFCYLHYHKSCTLINTRFDWVIGIFSYFAFLSYFLLVKKKKKQ